MYQIVTCTTDQKFSLFPFTAESSEAVCCIVIFQGKQGEAPSTWRTCVDHSVNPILHLDGKDIDINANFGGGKNFPGGPT